MNSIAAPTLAPVVFPAPVINRPKAAIEQVAYKLGDLALLMNVVEEYVFDNLAPAHPDGTTAHSAIIVAIDALKRQIDVLHSITDAMPAEVEA